MFFVFFNLIFGSLDEIYISHGELSPVFRKDIFKYKVKINKCYSFWTLTPMYANEVQIDEENKESQLLRSFDLRPGYRRVFNSSFKAKVYDQNNQAYDINVEADCALPKLIDLNIKSYSANEHVEIEHDDSYLCDDIVNKGDDVFKALVSEPYFYLTAECSNNSWITLNDKKYWSYKFQSSIKRDLINYRQTISISCHNNNGIAKTFLSILSKYDLIPSPKLILIENNKSCEVDELKATIVCYEVSGSNSARIMQIEGVRDILYTVEDDVKNPSIQIRILFNIPSLRIPVNNLFIVGRSGNDKRVWQLLFRGRMKSSKTINSWFAWLIGQSMGIGVSCLALLIFISLFTISGLPKGTGDVLFWTTFLLQYLVFISASYQSTELVRDFARSLSWVIMFKPLPEYILSATFFGDPKHTLLNKIISAQSAFGCICYGSLCIFISCLLRKISADISNYYDDSTNSCKPHSRNYGFMEYRIFFFLQFPMITAASFLLCYSSVLNFRSWLVCSTSALLVLLCFFKHNYTQFIDLKHHISHRNVVWVWHVNSKIYDENGQFMDAVCDQVTTLVNDSTWFIKNIFSFQWAVEVGDIEKVELLSAAAKKKVIDEEQNLCVSDLYKSNDLTKINLLNCTNNAYKLGKSRAIVAGVLKTSWMELGLSYCLVSKIFKTVDNKNFNIKNLSCEVSQLQGPLTGGKYSFYFTGIRVPFTKVLEQIFRYIAGVCLGLILAMLITSQAIESIRHLIIFYSIVGCFAGVTLIFSIVTQPYALLRDNVILITIHFICCTTAFSFIYNSIFDTHDTVISKLLSLISVITALGLCGYCYVVILFILTSLFKTLHSRNSFVLFFIFRVFSFTIPIKVYVSGKEIVSSTIAKAKDKIATFKIRDGVTSEIAKSCLTNYRPNNQLCKNWRSTKA